MFAIVELAELIFLHLPMYHILQNVQRTSRRWKATVEGSTPLQRSLFLKPVTKQALGHRPGLSILHIGMDVATTGEWILLNPFAAHRCSRACAHHRSRASNRLEIGHDILTPLGKLYAHHSKRWDAPLLRSEASWRCQLLTQPPIHQVTFNGMHGEKVITARPDAAGITLQDFIDGFGSYVSWDPKVGFTASDGTVCSFVKTCPAGKPNFDMLQEIANMQYTGAWSYEDGDFRSL